MKSVKGVLVLSNAVLVCAVAVAVGLISLFALKEETSKEFEDYKGALRQGYDESVRYQVQNVISLLNGIYEQQTAGELTEEEAKAQARELVKALRYNDDGDGYFWIDDTEAYLIAHPFLEEQEGENRWETADQNGVKLIQAIIETATKNPEGGFNEFYFMKPGQEEPAPKRAYSMLFEPYGWIVSTGNYIDDIDAVIGEKDAQMQRQIGRVTRSVAGSVAAAVVLASIVAFFNAGTFTGPLKKIEALAGRLSEGDFTRGIQLKRRNEFGRTARALDAAQENVKALLQEIITVSNTLETAAAGLNDVFQTAAATMETVDHAISDMADGAVNQAETTDETARHVGDMGENISRTVDYIGALSSSAHEIEVSSKEALDTLGGLNRTNMRTMEQVQVIYEQTGTTNESVQKIKQATEFINSIAEETNLLSLNASIEAARAGDAGRGFAVVADQISKLAVQSAESVKQIDGVVKNLLTDSDKEVQIMEEVRSVITQESGELKKAKEMFDRVYSGINESLRAVREISGLAGNLDDSRQSVVGFVGTLSDIARDNAAGTQETSASTAELTGRIQSAAENVEVLKQAADELQGHVGKFRI